MAQDCDFGSDQAFDATAKMLTEAKSCSSAADIMHKCAWGSSADSQLAPIAIDKCEKSFFDALSGVGKNRYEQEMQLCAYRYAKAEGTISISEAALCQVDVAARFAANPRQAEKPLPRATFDCADAKTPLETAICSDVTLGKADIVLSRVYGAMLKSVDSAQRTEVIRSQKQWLQRVPEICGLSSPNSPLLINCIRNQFERRFTDLDGCFEETLSCLQEVDDEEKQDASAANKPRASFNCEKPTSALQIIICADARLGKADIELANAYAQAKTAMRSEQQVLAESERHWLQYVTEACPMGAAGGIPPVLTRACVRSAFEVRIEQLRSCANKKGQDDRTRCLNEFRVLGKN
jgi:uncharacterized protein